MCDVFAGVRATAVRAGEQHGRWRVVAATRRAHEMAVARPWRAAVLRPLARIPAQRQRRIVSATAKSLTSILHL